MSQQPYQIGDIVNGYRWSGTTWEPVASAPSGTPVSTTPPPGGGKPVWKRWWFWVLVVLGGFVLIGVIGNASGGGKTASSAAASNPAAEPSPSSPATTAGASPSSEASSAPAPSPTAEASTVPAEPTVEPTPTPDPANWGPITLKGSGSKVVKIAKPDDRAAIVTLTHNGESNFAVWSLDSNLKENDLLVNTIGSYKGTVLLDEGASDVTKRLKVDADGDWTITIKDISTAPRVGTSLSGNGDGVYIYTGPAGVISANASGDSNFAVWSYGADSDLIFNEIAPYTGESTVGEGPIIIAVEASAKWSMKVTP